MGHLRRTIRLVAAAFVATIVGVGIAQPARAAIDINFNNVTGTTYLAKPKVTSEIPKSTIATKIDLDTGTLTGQASIPDLTVKLNLAHLIGVTSVVRIVPAGDLTGTVDLGNSKLSTTTRFTLQLRHVHLDAAPKINLVPSGCRTKQATSATLVNTTPIDLFNGTTVSGTFTLPSFTRCGLLTPLLTLLLSGPHNVMTLTLK